MVADAAQVLVFSCCRRNDGACHITTDVNIFDFVRTTLTVVHFNYGRFFFEIKQRLPAALKMTPGMFRT